MRRPRFSTVFHFSYESLRDVPFFLRFCPPRNKQIERFDPYGNTSLIDQGVDETLEEELTWNTGFYYLNVKKYLPVAGFQNLSDENNILLQNIIVYNTISP